MSLKKILFLFLIITFSAVPNLVSAQDEEQEYDFERSYQDYVFAQDVYQRKDSDYLLARSQYLQAGTLVSQTQARDATVEMLQARDDVVIHYVNSLKFKLIEAEGITSIVSRGYLNRLDAELFWFQDHKERISSAGTLESLVVDSNEAKTRFDSFTIPVAYEVLSTISAGKITVLRNELNGIATDLKAKTASIKSAGDHDVEVTDRWYIEIDNKLTRSLDESIEADTLKSSIITAKQGSSEGIYNTILNRLGESQQLLREGSNFIREVIRVIVSPA